MEQGRRRFIQGVGALGGMVAAAMFGLPAIAAAVPNAKKAIKVPGAPEIRKIKSGCAVYPNFCGIEATVVNGVIRAIYPDAARAGTVPVIEAVDEIIAATGARQDLAITRELRLRLDSWLETTKALAPLINPNLHTCGTVRHHGHHTLVHPEPRCYAGRRQELWPCTELFAGNRI